MCHQQLTEYMHVFDSNSCLFLWPFFSLSVDFWTFRCWKCKNSWFTLPKLNRVLQTGLVWRQSKQTILVCRKTHYRFSTFSLQAWFSIAREFLHVCICFCLLGSWEVRIDEDLLSGSWDQKLNGVTMTPDTSPSTPAASSVSPSSPAASLSISMDLLHIAAPLPLFFF